MATVQCINVGNNNATYIPLVINTLRLVFFSSMFEFFVVYFSFPLWSSSLCFFYNYFKTKIVRRYKSANNVTQNEDSINITETVFYHVSFVLPFQVKDSKAVNFNIHIL